MTRDREPGRFPDPDEMMRLAEQSRYRDLLSDVSGRRRRLFEALANSDDPLWREIGEQLREGRIRPSDVLQSEVYWNKIQEGLTEHADDFRQAIQAAKEQLEAESEEREK
ncbi:MAG TPA: hypothetical protein VIL37_15925 [Natronosporangium sp.]